MKINNLTRIFVAAISAALILFLALFTTACTPKDNQEINTNTSVSPVPNAQAAPEPVNLGTFTVVIPDNGKYLLGTENETIRQAIMNKIVSDKGMIVDINVIPLPYDDYANQIFTLSSSGQVFECIVDKYSTLQDYISKGWAIALDDLLLENGQNLLNTIDVVRWNEVTYNNSIMAVPGASLPENTAMYVRYDMLYKMGMPKIKTRLEFEASLVALSTLLPLGITPLAMNWSQALDYMTYLHHVPANDFTNEGNGFFMREQDKFYVDFLDMMKKFYSRKYLPSDFFDISEEEISTLFTSGLAMMYLTEYPNIADEYEKLLSIDSSADVILVPNPTYRRMREPRLSGESTVADIGLFTSNGQNHKALMVYLDWMISDVEKYETTRLGIMGTHINFNNMDHEFEYLGQYADNKDLYYKIFSLGVSYDGIFSQVVPINGDAVRLECAQLQKLTYNHLSTAIVTDEGNYTLSQEAQDALYYYRSSVNEAVRRYIIGEIDYNEFKRFLGDNDNNAAIIINELNAQITN